MQAAGLTINSLTINNSQYSKDDSNAHIKAPCHWCDKAATEQSYVHHINWEAMPLGCPGTGSVAWGSN